MENRNRIIVLNAFSIYLRVLKAYKSENFERSDRNRLVQNVCLAFGMALFLATIPIVTILSIWHILEIGAAVAIIVVTMPHIITMWQLLSTYVTMTMKIQFICETIQQLQKHIDHRKFSLNFRWSSKNCTFLWDFVNKTSLSIGCKDSKQSYDYYDQVERKCSLISTLLVKMPLVVIIVAFSLSAMFPILYVIWDYPPPQLWVLPIKIQWVKIFCWAGAN